MKVIGITGQIAAGKSEVTRYLKEKGFFVISADEISRELSAPGRAVYNAIVETFGRGFLLPDGALDRGALARHVFSDKGENAKLNAAVWPILRAEVKTRMTGELCFVEAALLVEAEMDRDVDAVWVVRAPAELRKKRLMERLGCDSREAELRISAQDGAGEESITPDAVIDNGGERSRLYEQIEAALARVR